MRTVTGRRSFLRSLLDSAAALATGGLGKVAEAMTSKRVIKGCWGTPAVASVMKVAFVRFSFPNIESRYPMLDVAALVGLQSMKLPAEAVRELRKMVYDAE